MPPKAAPRRAATRRQAGNDAGANTNAPIDPALPDATPVTGSSAPPTRPPVQRLQSLKKRTPAGSIAPSSKPSALPGEPAKPTLKYQPRAVGRRSKEEREAMEKLEAERHRERLAEAAAIQRGRGGAGPGRGAFRGRGGARGMGSGPLGSGMAGRRGRGGAFSGRFGPDSRMSSVSRRSRSIIDGGTGAAGHDVSSDESDSGIRVSIDQINLDESDEDDFDEPKKDAKGKMPVKNVDPDRERGLRPIRVERREHEERVVSVNMESSSSKSAELREKAKADQDDALFVEEDAPSPAEHEPVVKQEPTDGDEVMADDIPLADQSIITDDGLLPEQTVKVRRKLKAKETPAAKDTRRLLRTKEEIEEFDRHAEDLEVIKDLLVVEPKEPQDEPPAVADDEAEVRQEAEDEDELVKDKLSGQLFLMQFPPMTPNLVVSGSAEGRSSEGSAHREASEGISRLDAVKREEDRMEVPEAGAPTVPEPPKIVTATDWQLRAGRVGKLNVHASGRVTMDWGGISFELDRATAVDFLQEALIVSSPSDAPAPDDRMAEEKKVWAMGQLSGKFTVTPNWESIL